MAALVLFTLSCGSARRFAAMDGETAHRDQLWDTTVQVLGKYFPIAESRPEEGTIRTGYNASRGDSLLSQVPGTVLKPISLRRKPYAFRWMAEAEIVEAEGRHFVRLRVTKEREDTEAVEGYVPGAYETDSSQHGTAGGRIRTGTGQIWTNVGRDRDMENRLLREIRTRLFPEAAPKAAAQPGTL